MFDFWEGALWYNNLGPSATIQSINALILMMDVMQLGCPAGKEELSSFFLWRFMGEKKGELTGSKCKMKIALVFWYSTRLDLTGCQVSTVLTESWLVDFTDNSTNPICAVCVSPFQS